MTETHTSPIERATGRHYCQHGDHGVAVLMPAEYRETEGAKRFLCETHALPAIAEFGIANIRQLRIVRARDSRPGMVGFDSGAQIRDVSFTPNGYAHIVWDDPTVSGGLVPMHAQLRIVL